MGLKGTLKREKTVDRYVSLSFMLSDKISLGVKMSSDKADQISTIEYEKIGQKHVQPNFIRTGINLCGQFSFRGGGTKTRITLENRNPWPISATQIYR